jgi:hypothetical protein
MEVFLVSVWLFPWCQFRPRHDNQQWTRIYLLHTNASIIESLQGCDHFAFHVIMYIHTYIHVVRWNKTVGQREREREREHIYVFTCVYIYIYIYIYIYTYIYICIYIYHCVRGNLTLARPHPCKGRVCNISRFFIHSPGCIDTQKSVVCPLHNTRCFSTF